ncbi:MAG: glutathione S-transferase domain-containing protein, partial [Nitratireductor sp.]
YTAPDAAALQTAAETLGALFDRVEAELGEGPWFAGARFTLVDAVFGPIFRYFDSFDRIGDFGILADKPKIAAWRQALAARPSVRNAVGADYPERLAAFLRARNSEISRRMD